MSTPPSRSESQTFPESSAIPASTPLLEHPDQPLLFKPKDDTTSMNSHIDENNENDAVCISSI